MNGTLQEKWNALREKRSRYPRFRQTLLWVRDIGLIVDVVLCMQVALYASPTVLTDHPWLQDYVDFIGGYFVAVHRLSAGALYPQVSQLVFAVGWGMAIVPFAASLLHTFYLLLFDYQATKQEMARSYEEKIVRNGRLIDILAIPVVTLLLLLMALGDLGLGNPSFGWVNGVGMTKSESSQGHLVLMHLFFMRLYTSRWGLGIVSSIIVVTGVVLYSSAWLIPVFKGPIWLRRRFSGQGNR